MKWNAWKKRNSFTNCLFIVSCLFLAFAQCKLKWHLAFNDTAEHRCLENRVEQWDSMTKIKFPPSNLANGHLCQCNGGQFLRAVQVNLTPLNSRSTLATDWFLSGLLAHPPAMPDIPVQIPLGARMRTLFKFLTQLVWVTFHVIPSYFMALLCAKYAEIETGKSWHIYILSYYPAVDCMSFRGWMLSWIIIGMETIFNCV